MTSTHPMTGVLLTFVALGTTLPALAGERTPATAGSGMERALAKADEGAVELRRFLQRTQPIYMLSFAEVVRERDARRDRRPAAVALSSDAGKRSAESER